MILCIDCGLTNGKVLLFSNSGVCEGQTMFHTPLSDMRIDTFALRESLFTAIKELITHSNVKPQDITCVTVSGHGNGLYLVGETDVLPAGFSSMFTESASELPQTIDTFPIISQSNWAGQPLPILAWLKKTQRETYREAKTILFCKDLLRWFLTGVAVTEETDASAAGLLNKHGGYDYNLLRIYGLADAFEKLPPVLHSDSVAGRVTGIAAQKTGLKEGTPVLGGLFDVNSCMLGTGVIDSGVYSVIAGTWGINATPTRELVQIRNITQSCRFFGKSKYVSIDSAPTSCTNLEWFSQTVLGNLSYDKVNDLVLSEKHDPDLIYMPYIYAPMDSPEAQGMFIGLKPWHTSASLLRAVYEGIILEHRSRLEKLKQAGLTANSAVLSGGASSSPVFGQMFADICGMEFRVPEQSQAGALGGAILGLTASRVYPTIEAAVSALVKIDHVYKPDKREGFYYEQKYLKFKDIQMKMSK